MKLNIFAVKVVVIVVVIIVVICYTVIVVVKAVVIINSDNCTGYILTRHINYHFHHIQGAIGIIFPARR